MGILNTRRKDQELKVVFNDDTLIVAIDRKETIIPLLWYQILQNASDEDKANWVLSSDGKKLVWGSLNVEIGI